MSKNQEICQFYYTVILFHGIVILFALQSVQYVHSKSSFEEYRPVTIYHMTQMQYICN